VAARAFAEHGVLAEQFHARFVVRLLAAIAGDAHHAGDHAAHGAVVVVQHFGSGEAGEDLDLERFGLFSQPAAQVAQ
jgi:hypothetical protein